MTAVGWPAVLTDGDVRLRPLRRRDQDAWMELRQINAGWLEPWDATSPVPVTGPRPSFGAFVRTLASQARAGTNWRRPGGEIHPVSATAATDGRNTSVWPAIARSAGRTNTSNDTCAATGCPWSAKIGTARSCWTSEPSPPMVPKPWR